MKTKSEVFNDLCGLLSNFQGREYSGEITEQSRFVQDLGFSSIDVILLGEALETKFETQLPFGKFLAELGAKNSQDVTIGELAEFLAANIS